MLPWRVALHVLVGAACVIGQIRIDDANVYNTSNLAGIQYYDSTWRRVVSGDYTQRYQGTYVEGQAYGSQLWFAFRGNAITYYADKDPGFGAVTLSIDGSANINLNWTNPSPAALYQQAIWTSGDLGQGDHTIVIGNTNTDNTSIGLDYFSISSTGSDARPQGYGPGALNVSAGAVLVNNEDGKISWQGDGWTQSVVNSVSATIQARYFGGTIHCTKIPGAAAVFSFVGTAVWYFADAHPSNSKVRLSIDGVEGGVVDTATTGTTWTTQKLWWGISGLSPGTHTLTLTHVGQVGDYACVDFFMYLPSSAGTPTASRTTIFGDQPPSTTFTSTFTSTSRPPLLVTLTRSFAPTSTASPFSAKSTPVGAIVGGVVAGVAAIILLIISVVLLRRRRSRRIGGGMQHEVYTGDAAYQSKEAGAPYAVNTLGPTPPATFDQRQYIQYANLGGGGLNTPKTNWAGLAYSGHPEPQ